ncbi:oligosaccharide flippase family protein, partial [Arthrospira platensis SPKY2]
MRTGALWIFMGSTGNQLLAFAFGIVLARLLAPEVFGMLLTIQVFTGIAGFVAGGGMGQALVRAKDTEREDYDLVFTLQLIIGCLIYALFFFTAPIIANWY